jgi:hypothetical protein
MPFVAECCAESLAECLAECFAVCYAECSLIFLVTYSIMLSFIFHSMRVYTHSCCPAFFVLNYDLLFLKYIRCPSHT